MKLFRWIPLGLLMVPALSGAATYILDFDTKVSDDPWTPYKVATMTIADNGADSVLITLKHYARPSNVGQKISMLWFGIDPFTTPTQSGQTPLNVFKNFSVKPGGHQSIGSGYNFELELEQSFWTNSDALFQGMTASFVLSGTGVDAGDFVRSTASGEAGDIYAAIHLQDVEGGGSVKVGAGEIGFPPSEAVPEPASMAMAGFAAAAAISGRRKLKASKKK